MTSDQGVTLGEIGRIVADIKNDLHALRGEVRERNHTLANQMQAALGPISALTVRVGQTEEDVDRIAEQLRTTDKEVSKIHIKAAYVSGIVAAVFMLLKIIIESWKR